MFDMVQNTPRIITKTISARKNLEKADSKHSIFFACTQKMNTGCNESKTRFNILVKKGTINYTCFLYHEFLRELFQHSLSLPIK